MTLVTDVLYGYTIQGFMHAQTLDNNHDYIVNLAPRPDGSPRPLEVNRATANLRTDTRYPTPGASRPAQEMPILTAFYSINYPKPLPPPLIPNPSNDIPVQNSPTYRPNTGYYPFSEVGWMIFSPSVAFYPGGLPEGTLPLIVGRLHGRARVNTAGYGGSGDGADFTGSYKYDQMTGNMPFRLPSGFITIQFNTLLDHVWDYSFIEVSPNEFFLAATGRAPRPGVATGTMKRTRS